MNQDNLARDDNAGDCQLHSDRRGLLKAIGAATINLIPAAARADSDDPRRMMRPQVGDVFVRFEGDQDGPVISAAELKAGDVPIVAWAMDPKTNLPRDGSRLNQVLLLRLDPSTLDAKTSPHAVDGLLAYSAICTHAQCTVTGWIKDRQVLHCPCHQSEYDPRQDAKVVSGPAPRALAVLPLKLNDGKPEVAAQFIGKVGMTQQM